jgi:FkbM family methyltransferase
MPTTRTRTRRGSRLWLLRVLNLLAAWRSRLRLPRLGIGRRAYGRLSREVSVKFDGLKMTGSRVHVNFLSMVRTGDWEPLMTDWFVRVVNRGAVVLDVGAHIGYYSVLAACEGAMVLAIEPDARNVLYLRRNCEQNDVMEQVRVCAVAASDRSGKFRFRSGRDASMSTLFEVEEIEGDFDAEVDAVVLDTLIPRDMKVDIVKLDCEGSELHALRGLERTIAETERLTMFVEFWPHGLLAAQTSPKQLLDHLADACFDVQVIDEDTKRLRPLEELGAEWIDGTSLPPFAHVNLLCRKTGSGADAVTHEG